MMHLSPELIADSVVSLASLLGLVLFAQVLRAQQPRTTVTRRFLFALQLVVVLLAIRLLQWMTGADWVGRLTFAFAGLVPLAMLLLSEAMMRRHAPRALKLLAAGGAAFFVLVALLTPLNHAQLAITALAVFQVITFAALGALVMMRDRASLSVAENTTIDRLALSLVLIIPLAFTDFRMELWDLPVRLSGIAILAMCWLGLTLRRGEATQSEVISMALAVAGGLLFAAICIMALADLNTRTTVQVMAVIVSIGLLALVYTQARLVLRSDKVRRVLSVLSDPELNDHKTFLNALQTRALTAGALILDGDSLGDFNVSFKHHFSTHPIVSSAQLDPISTPELAEQFAWFFQKFGASHAMLVSETPFKVMALNVPTLAQSEQFEQELRIAQRLAVMLARADVKDG